MLTQGLSPNHPRAQVYDGYMALARHVLKFDKDTFAAWRDGADAAAMAYLKQPILSKDPVSGWGLWLGWDAAWLIHGCLCTRLSRIL